MCDFSQTCVIFATHVWFLPNMCDFFKICKESGGQGPRRREPPSGFRLEDATLKSMISEEGASFNCDIDRMIFAGRDESEQHLRGEHFEEYKSLFARECFLKTRHHEKYREWETQEVYIEGLTFCNLDEMETHSRKLKKKQV